MKLEPGKLYRLKNFDERMETPFILLYEQGNYLKRTLEISVGDVFMFLGCDIDPKPKYKQTTKPLDHFLLLLDGRVAWYQAQTWIGREPGYFFERAGKKK